MVVGAGAVGDGSTEEGGGEVSKIPRRRGVLGPEWRRVRAGNYLAVVRIKKVFVGLEVERGRRGWTAKVFSSDDSTIPISGWPIYLTMWQAMQACEKEMRRM